MNTLQEFVELVAKMRVAQKEYFKHRTNGRLVTAKELEAKVDKAIKDLLTEKEENKQILLFPD